MATPAYVREEDINLYTRLLQEVKARMDAAGNVLDATPRSRPRADSIAVELRIVLELLLLGALITNRTEVVRVTGALHRHDPKSAKKLVEQKNPEYWPKPTKQIAMGPGEFRWEDITDGFLTASDWGPAYGFLSGQLHAANPYVKTPFLAEPLDPIYDRMAEIHRKIVTLTNHHVIQPVNREYVLAGLMQGSSGEVQVTLFQRQDQRASDSSAEA